MIRKSDAAEMTAARHLGGVPDDWATAGLGWAVGGAVGGAVYGGGRGSGSLLLEQVDLGRELQLVGERLGGEPRIGVAVGVRVRVRVRSHA